VQDGMPEVQEMDQVGYWIPELSELDQMTIDRFNTAGSKRLLSIHVYLKNINMISTLQQIDTQNPEILNRDLMAYTYANKYNDKTEGTLYDSKYVRQNGMPIKFTRGQKAYHSVIKSPCYARNCTKETLTTLGTKPWKQYTQEAELYGFTGGTSAQSRLNIDWFFMPVFPFIGSDLVLSVAYKFEVCVATKWALYGTATPYNP